MVLAEVRNAALEAAEKVSHQLYGTASRGPLGLLEEALYSHANHVRPLAAMERGLPIQFLEEVFRHANGDLSIHGMHCTPMGRKRTPGWVG